MKKSRLAAVAALALASGLVLTACSSSDDDTAAEPAASEAAAVEADADDMADEAEMADEAPASAGTIVDIAAGTDGFATLVAAADAAGLLETLSGEGPFTVFAPTDDAFAALPEGLVDALLLPENKDVLTKILTYHVVPGTVMAADIVDGDVATVEGQTVTLSTMDGVKVNEATVIQADIVADNGVVHVIDAVIVPADVDPAALLAQ
ncbi:MAG: fasciclin domain-containing protein [Candidatus Nanopelagicales bacterium]|nr:fasciclin domain-containing protein [Candidatus Nanopelagicales bacterium]MCF8557476.1 fasciclin domain-containing protein [Candidatus Nanopelagicales bacterium]